MGLEECLPGCPNALSCPTLTSCGPLMCPLLASMMRAAANEAPASETKYLSKPSDTLLLRCHKPHVRAKTHRQPRPEAADTWTSSPSLPSRLKQTGVGDDWMFSGRLYGGWRVER